MAFLFKSPKISEEERSGYMRARRRAFSGPLMFVVVVVAAIFVMSVFFRVEVIEVVGNHHYTAEEIIRAVDIEEGDNLFFFDRFAAVGRAFSKLPYIESVTIERSLPNKVVITVIPSIVPTASSSCLRPTTRRTVPPRLPDVVSSRTAAATSTPPSPLPATSARW